MNELLVRVIAEQAAFLELSGDDVVDPDSAVAQLEAIASALQALSVSEQQQFALLTRQLADHQKDQRRADFFRNLAPHLGLT
jgi:hypothetical protein